MMERMNVPQFPELEEWLRAQHPSNLEEIAIELKVRIWRIMDRGEHIEGADTMSYEFFFKRCNFRFTPCLLYTSPSPRD